MNRPVCIQSRFPFLSGLCLLVAAGAFAIPVHSQPSSNPFAAVAKELAQPADEIEPPGGTRLRISPLRIFPGQSPQMPLDVEPLDKPEASLTVPPAAISSIRFFEDLVLEKIEPLLKKTDSSQADLEAADSLLQDLARWHESARSRAPLTPDPWRDVGNRVFEKLVKARSDRLASLGGAAKTEQDWQEALRLSENWLGLKMPGLRNAIRTLWLRYGDVKLKENNLVAVRGIVNQLDEHFLNSAPVEPLRQALRGRALALGKEAKDLANEQALVKLEEALKLWPRAPDLRDDLEKRKGTYRTLTIAVRQLPENLSPATAWTYTEQQALDLIFDRLVKIQFDEVLGQRYQSDLAAEVPHADRAVLPLRLRRDAFWSDGERLTSADVRHTAQLLRSTSAWRDLVEIPRFEGRPFALSFTLKQGLLDPLALLRFHVLPQKYRGRPLSSADDSDFAKAPVGSGPFQAMGLKKEGTRAVALFQANPYSDRPKKHRNAIRAVRMVAWNAPSDLGQPLPQLVLQAPGRHVTALKKLGYSNIQALPSRRVYFLAVNHRVPMLGNQDLRRALAHAIPRDKVLDECFRDPAIPSKLTLPLSGPFPAGSWAACSPPRVPEDPYQPELAKSFAKKAAQALGTIRLRLKFPTDVPGVPEACAAMAEHAHKLFAEVKAPLTIELVPLSSVQMRDALRGRDYELAYHHWDFPDDNFWLWPLFDPDPEASRPGGSNFLGYDNDAILQRLLRSAMSHRHFPTVRDIQQSIHAHLYERMPLIPLWQLPVHVAVHPSLTVPVLDAQNVFANISEWRLE